jgi:hypothetical protein
MSARDEPFPSAQMATPRSMNEWTNPAGRNRCEDIREKRVRARERKVPAVAGAHVQQLSFEAELAQQFPIEFAQWEYSQKRRTEAVEACKFAERRFCTKQNAPDEYVRAT